MHVIPFLSLNLKGDARDLRGAIAFQTFIISNSKM